MMQLSSKAAFVKGQDVEVAFVAGYGADLAIDWLPGVLDCFNATHAYVRMRDKSLGPVVVELPLMRHPQAQDEDFAGEIAAEEIAA